MELSELIVLCKKLARNPQSEWVGCVKNQCHDLAILGTGNETIIAPIRYITHHLQTGLLNRKSVSNGAVYANVISCLQTSGYIQETRKPHEKTEAFREYKNYYKSLLANDTSKFKSRKNKQMTFWAKGIAATNVAHDNLTKDHIVKAMARFDSEGIPEGFRDPQKWYVSHPDTGSPYPAKIIWGLATSQRGSDFTAHQARDALRKLGFECAILDQSDFPPEHLQTSPLVEGTESQATRTIRERNPVARKLCIDHYRSQNDGRLACIICTVDFSKIYGELGEGFIHVHHLDPLAEAEGVRSVSPELDLVPVCPNCHAMIHRHGTTRSISEIMCLMKRNKD